MDKHSSGLSVKMNIDFSSALYLGMVHPWINLDPWKQLTTGKPSALEEGKLNKLLAEKLANMQGLTNGILGTSTLHIFWDLFSLWKNKNVIIYYDECCYPVIRWGIERAKFSGCRAIPFSHQSVNSLYKRIELNKPCGAIPIIATDGWCVLCGKGSPVADYLEIAGNYHGFVVIDDTQAFGLLGKRPSEDNIYGKGGGGILQWLGIANSPGIITVNSLAKAFGVPVAVMSASEEIVDGYRKTSQTRIHSSPPNFSVISSIQDALKINDSLGDYLREKLFDSISYFRRVLNEMEISLRGSIFPVQTIPIASPSLLIKIYRQLKFKGIAAIPVRSHGKTSHGLSFCITSQHKNRDFNLLGEELYKIYSTSNYPFRNYK